MKPGTRRLYRVSGWVMLALSAWNAADWMRFGDSISAFLAVFLAFLAYHDFQIGAKRE